MFRMTAFILTLFCSNIGLSGEFTKTFSEAVLAQEKAMELLRQFPYEVMDERAVFNKILKLMNQWCNNHLDYYMEREDQYLYWHVHYKVFPENRNRKKKRCTIL